MPWDLTYGPPTSESTAFHAKLSHSLMLNNKLRLIILTQISSCNSGCVRHSWKVNY
jgi:hypothetical protein